MDYRRLGSSGLRVSVLSFGAWVTFKTQMDEKLALRCMEQAHDFGVNFFDNAEAYAGGEAERLMGNALKKLNWRRSSYIVSTKFFWGLESGVNEENTLNRKYLMQAIDGSLKRFGLDFVDLVYCHRPDSETPIEETVRAMHDMVASGKALYWGTSEWSARQIREAWDIAEKHHLHKPQMEQPQYNLFWRKRVEQEYAALYKDIGLGLTTWSPLASGLLSGKYNSGIPKDGRLALQGYEWLKQNLTEDKLNAVRKLEPIAKELGCTLSQLAIAWCAQNQNVSTVITGASRPEQVKENMQALEFIPRVSGDIAKRIEACVAGVEERFSDG